MQDKSTIKRVLDITRPNTNKPIFAVSGDYGVRKINAIIAADGEPITVPATAAVVISAERPDAASDSFLGETNGDGSVTVPVTQWMVAIEGEVECSVSVTTSGGKISTTCFYISVQKSPNIGEVSEDDPEYDLLSLVLASENERQENENERQENENERQENENKRVEAEEKRAEEFEGWKIGVYTESDPTVPAWAKKPNPPTPAEIGAIAMFTTSKRLELPGWYRVGTLSMGVLHTAAVRLIIGGQFNHSAHRTQIVDISVDYVEGYITKAVDTVNASNVTKVRLYRLNATDVAIDIYYATTGGNNVRVYVEQLFGSFATGPLDDVTSLSGTILAELDLNECANPPMQLGVEYRTTERWQGYPVYVKCFNIGRVERGTTTIEHGISIRLALETKLYANTNTEITLSNLVTNLNTERAQTNIVTTSAFGSCELFLKYTKL